MKIATSGKGGGGKVLPASLLTRTSVESGYSIIAIGAGPDASLTAPDFSNTKLKARSA